MSFVPTEVSRKNKDAVNPGHPILDFSRRAELTECMDEPCTREELRACLQDLARLNRWFFGYRPTLAWLDSIILPAQAEPGRRTGNYRPIRILDVGCGYGDVLRRIARWAIVRDVAVDLTGLDVNPDAVAIAAEVDDGAKAIHWVCADVFAYEPPDAIDLVVSSLFTHHLQDAEVVRFIQWMEKRTRTGWFVNDLSRAAIPYSLLGAFAKIARLHPFVQHDGPVSIARSFRPVDWQTLCEAAGLRTNEYRISAYQPARLCVARSKR